MSLVSDLFPNITFEHGSQGDLEDSIRDQVEEEGLIFHEPWVLKIMQVLHTFHKINLDTGY